MARRMLKANLSNLTDNTLLREEIFRLVDLYVAEVIGDDDSDEGTMTQEESDAVTVRNTLRSQQRQRAGLTKEESKL